MPTVLKSNHQWNALYVFANHLEDNYEDVVAFQNSFQENTEDWEEFGSSDHILDMRVPCDFHRILSPFMKLILYKIFRPDKLLFAISDYIRENIGEKFASLPPCEMKDLYKDSDNITPVIFVLNQGADPSIQLFNFSKLMHFDEKFKQTSLGQGQEEVAKKLIDLGKKQGEWILLQNCHLFKSWMVQLEQIVASFADDKDDIHPDFRLFLTSMPADYFPVSILQNGLKLTTEPPRGLKANIQRSYNNITEREFEDCANSEDFKKLLYGLCFFHGVVQERRKFGPLGFNIRYEFNDSDLETSITMLREFLNDPESEENPWDAMEFMFSSINYGGRVTDDWDKLLVRSIFNKYFSIETLEDGFSDLESYTAPNCTSLQQYKDFINNLPSNDDPEVFGLHANANIAYMKQESDSIVQTILDIQPRITTGAGGKSSDEVIQELVEDLKKRKPLFLDTHACAKDLFKTDHSGLMHCLSTVLAQEIERFNKLLHKINDTLISLDLAIQGLVLMSPELDEMYSSFLKNQVPPNWMNVSYLSLKPLGSWVEDLIARVDFMRNWLEKGHPDCFWLSGFFFPHGFMTGALQTFARKHGQAIDLISFGFEVMKERSAEEIENSPEDGILIYGLFLEGAQWNEQTTLLDDQDSGQMYSPMPIIHFLPEVNHEHNPENDYQCPVYKTSERAGILSTTGQSTNYILAVELPIASDMSESMSGASYWTLRSAALLTMLDD